MNLNISGKWALVTGATRGLGKAIAESLAQEKVNVIWAGRDESALQHLCKEAGEQYGNTNKLVLVDFETETGAKELIAGIGDLGVAPDILINNVGGNLNETDPLSSVDAWKQVFHFNLYNAIEINNAFIPSMQARKWGRICHVSSIASLENQGTPMYCAAKAALNAYIRSVGRYVSPDNVIMTAVLPGAVFTEGGFWDTASKERPEHVEKYLNERMAIKRFGTPKEISEFVTFLVSDKSSFAVGTSVLLDGGQGRVFHEG